MSPTSGSVPDERSSSTVEIRRDRRAGLRLQGDVEGLATLRPPEPDDQAINIDVADPEQSDTAVAGCGGFHRPLESIRGRCGASPEASETHIPRQVGLTSAPPVVLSAYIAEWV